MRTRSLIAFVVVCLASSSALAERAIVVFGSAVAPDGRPKPPLLSRLRTALDLSRRDPGARLFVSGGAVISQPEGPAMKRWLVARGVDPRRIVVESRARFTAQNADFTAPLLKKAGVTEVVAVTERYHLRRALFHLKWALRASGLRSVKVRGVGAPDRRTGTRPARLWIKESVKILRDAAFRVRTAVRGKLRALRGRRSRRSPARLRAASRPR